ncbi:beta strand repeat-containing protein, partial [Cereibacter sphaeroides]
TVGGVTGTFSVTTGDDVPNAFSFAPVGNAVGGSTVTSASATINGLTLPADVSVTGGEVSIAGGAWVTSGTISNGQSIAARLIAATGTNGGSRTAAVTVGGVAASFVVTTIDTTPAAFSFAGKTAQPLSTLVTSTATTVTGITSAAAVSVSAGAEISTDNGATWATTDTVANNGTVMVRLTSSASVSTATSATVTIGGVNGTFTVTTGDNMPDAFTYASVANAAGGTLVTSANATMAGMTLPGTVTVSGTGSPQVSIAGGAWGTGGTISNGQTLAVRLTSDPGTAGGSQTATVNVSGRTATFTVTTIDTTPAAFSFPARTGVAFSTLTTSAAATISGITAPASVTVTGGEISVAGGAWATSGTIDNGETLSVRLTSAATGSTAKSATVTVGGQSAIFSVTTGDTTPAAYSFAPVSNAVGGSVVTSGKATITGISLPAPVSVTGGEVSINGSTTWVTNGTITSGQTLAVRLTAATGTNGGSRTAAVTVGGVGANFVVTTIDTTPAAFNFASRTDVALSTAIASATATITGITAPANVTVTGGLISVAGGGWVSSDTISAGETLAVRVTSAGTVSTTRTATVTVGGVSDTYSVTTGTNIPNAFSFTDKTNQTGGALITSNAVTMSGMTLAGTVTVSGEGSPQVSIDGGAFGSGGSISNGETLAVRLTSVAGTNGGTNTATVTVSGVSATFDVTTKDTTPASFSFTDKTNVATSTATASNLVTISGITSAAPISISGTGAPAYSIDGAAYTSAAGTIANGQTLRLRLTSAGSPSVTRTATVVVGGVSRTFDVTTTTGASVILSSVCRDCTAMTGWSPPYVGTLPDSYREGDACPLSMKGYTKIISIRNQNPPAIWYNVLLCDAN